MTNKQKKEAVREFLTKKFEDTGANIVESTKDSINLVDQHYLSAMMMSIKILLEENEKEN